MATDPDLVGLTRALEGLSGTETEEQVFVVPASPTQSWHLDVVELDEGDGPRFAVYAEYGGDQPFTERGLPVPEGSSIEADEGSNSTIILGELAPGEAAQVLARWAELLSNGSSFEWSATPS